MPELPQIGLWSSLIGAVILAISYTSVTAKAVISQEETAGYPVFGKILFFVPVSFAIIYLGLFST